MKASALLQARNIVSNMPSGEAHRLRAILSARMQPRRRTQLIAESGLSIGALQVAAAFHKMRSDRRRAA